MQRIRGINRGIHFRSICHFGGGEKYAAGESWYCCILWSNLRVADVQLARRVFPVSLSALQCVTNGRSIGVALYGPDKPYDPGRATIPSTLNFWLLICCTITVTSGSEM